VAQDAFSDLHFLVSSLGAAPLDQVVGSGSVDALFGGTYPYAQPVTQLGQLNGHVYAIPWTLSTPVLFYNADLFKAAGLDPSQPPTNWDQVKADALQIKTKTGAMGLLNGCVGIAAGETDWCLQAILDSAGGSVETPDQTRLTFTDPKSVLALQTMRDLARSGAMTDMATAQWTQAFGAGKLGMVLNTSALQSTLIRVSKGHFAMRDTTMPGFGSNPAVPTNSGSGLFLLTKDKLRQEAGWELMQYLASPAVMTKVTENVGYPPLRPGLASAPQYLQSWAQTNPYVAPNIAQLARLTPWRSYPGPNFEQIAGILVDASTSIVFQGADAQATMAKAQSQASGLLK
jgi:multiple sugar transport system substrate-binding protein